MSKIISVIGPTASGKTALSVALAKHYDGEIVSVDSMQLYKNMDVGTAKVTKSEMQGVPHHMIDVLMPWENCSVQRFVTMARQCVDDVVARNRYCILAGGTGLYVDHLIQDTQFADMPADADLREELNGLSGEVLLERLRDLDPKASQRLHVNDKKRIVRALEIVLLTGKSILYWEEQSHVNSSPLPAIMIGLNFIDRNYLYERINKRVDLMMDNGLLEEVLSLKSLPGFSNSTAAAGIGYKEILQYLGGKVTLEEAVEAIKQNSRRYAKRQITWFKRNEAIHWIDISRESEFETILQQAIDIVERN